MSHWKTCLVALLLGLVPTALFSEDSELEEAAPQVDQGLVLGFGLSHVEMGRLSYTAKNYAASSPLAYTPFELGYRWKNGFLVKAEVQLFFYVAESRELLESQVTVDDGEGGTTTKTVLTPGDKLYTHEYAVTNMVVACTYDVQLPFAVKPYVGTSVEILGSTRQPLSVRNWDPLNQEWGPSNRVIGERAQPAWGMTGSSAIVGLRWRLNHHWSLHAEGRYLLPYGGDIPPLSTVGLGVKFLL